MSNEYLVNDFAGQAPGSASAANSAASGSGFSNIVVGTGGAVGYADLGGGDMGLRITLGTGESYARWTATTPTRRAVIRLSLIHI